MNLGFRHPLFGLLLLLLGVAAGMARAERPLIARDGDGFSTIDLEGKLAADDTLTTLTAAMHMHATTATIDRLTIPAPGSAGRILAAADVLGTVAWSDPAALLGALYAKLDGSNQPFTGSITAPNVTASSSFYGQNSYITSLISGGTLGISGNGSMANIDVGDRMALGPSASIESNSQLRINSSATNPSVSFFGINNQPKMTVTTTNGNVVYAYNSDAQIDATGGTSTANRGAIGIFGKASSVGTGTVAGLVGVQGQVVNSGAGTVTATYGAYFPNAANTGGGTLLTAFGAYIAQQTAGVTNYNLYSQGNSSNIIEGPLTLGNSVGSGNTALNVVRNAVIGGSLSVSGSVTAKNLYAPAAVVPQDGVAFYCRMRGNDVAGLPNVITGVAASAVNGSPAAAAIYTDGSAHGSVGSCLLFDGSDDSINYGDLASTDPGTGDFSVACWVQTTATGSNRVMVGKRQNATGTEDGFAVTLSGTTCRFYLGDGSTGIDSATIASFSTINNGLWHHIAYSFERSASVNLYIDGEYIASYSIASVSGDINSSGGLYIGAQNNAQRWSGRLDEVLYFSRAISADEARRLYLHGTILMD